MTGNRSTIFEVVFIIVRLYIITDYDIIKALSWFEEREKSMFLVSIYFDEKTEERLRGLIAKVAEKSKNSYMIDANVPPHITISAFQTEQEECVIAMLNNQIAEMKKGEIQWVSIGVFQPSVIYLATVLNSYLHEISVRVYEAISNIETITISPCYQPLQWMPHTTIGKKLTKQEMLEAFQTLQHLFFRERGMVTRIGLAKTNPYEEICIWELEQEN